MGLLTLTGIKRALGPVVPAGSVRNIGSGDDIAIMISGGLKAADFRIWLAGAQEKDAFLWWRR